MDDRFSSAGIPMLLPLGLTVASGAGIACTAPGSAGRLATGRARPADRIRGGAFEVTGRGLMVPGCAPRAHLWVERAPAVTDDPVGFRFTGRIHRVVAEADGRFGISARTAPPSLRSSPLRSDE